MSAVFADTGYWIALLNSADGLHGKARALADTLWRRQVVTTDLVLVELLNYFAEQGERCRSMAAVLVSEINANPRITVVAFTADLLRWPLNGIRTAWTRAGASATVSRLW